jgi:quercetin dioxygenase-like cupin family protein
MDLTGERFLVDYAILLEGELWLEVDDGESVKLTGGDIVVQQATRHAWRNKSDQPATIAFIMLGASTESRSACTMADDSKKPWGA